MKKFSMNKLGLGFIFGAALALGIELGNDALSQSPSSNGLAAGKDGGGIHGIQVGRLAGSVRASPPGKPQAALEQERSTGNTTFVKEVIQ